MRSTSVHRFCRAEIVKVGALLCAALFLAGCASPDRPDLFATGRDARTYNPQTGRYEWPEDAAPAKPRAPRHAAPAQNDAGPDDGRVFNPQTGRFERADE